MRFDNFLQICEDLSVLGQTEGNCLALLPKGRLGSAGGRPRMANAKSQPENISTRDAQDGKSAVEAVSSHYPAFTLKLNNQPCVKAIIKGSSSSMAES